MNHAIKMRSHGYQCRNPSCETPCYSSGEPVTVSGWYGNVKYRWHNGRLGIADAACDAHKEKPGEQEAYLEWEEASRLLDRTRIRIRNAQSDPEKVREVRDLRAQEQTEAVTEAEALEKLKAIRGW